VVLGHVHMIQDHFLPIAGPIHMPEVSKKLHETHETMPSGHFLLIADRLHVPSGHVKVLSAHVHVSRTTSFSPP